MVRGISEYVRQVGNWSIYYAPGHFHNVFPDWFESWRGDGIIGRIPNQIVAQKLLAMGLPVVDALGAVPHIKFPLVHVDDSAIAKLAANHLLEHGFRSFAYCGVRGMLWSKQRRDVFLETIRRLGYRSYSYLLPQVGGKAWFSVAEHKRLTQWVAGLPKPIGIMAAYDWAGQKVLEACRSIGAMVPEEVAVIGVDNDRPICEICDPMLSSIIARHDRVGFLAAELLDKLMPGEA